MPLATGKLSIWTAKMNADTRPAIATCFSCIVSAAFFRQTATPAAATTPAPADVPASMNPSGMCIGLPFRFRSNANRQ